MEETLSKLDAYFADKKNKNIYFVAVFFIIVYLIYYVVFDLTQSYYDSQLNAYNNAKAAYAALPEPEDLTNQINLKKAQTAEKKQLLVKLQDNNTYLDARMKVLSDEFYRPEGVNAFMDYLSMQAKKNAISITSIENNSSVSQPLQFSELYNIIIEFKNASFNDIVRYVNSLEETNMIIDIDKISLNSSIKTINGSMNILAWGAKFE